MAAHALFAAMAPAPPPRGKAVNEEHQLVRLAQKGDRKARAVLISRFEPLLHEWAEHYKVGGTLSRDDLLQEGRVGLLVAIERFDTSKRTKFITYAYYKIHERMNLLVAQQGRTIRIPRHAIPELRAINELEREWRSQGRLRWSHADIAAELNMTLDTVKALINARHQEHIGYEDAADLVTDTPNARTIVHECRMTHAVYIADLRRDIERHIEALDEQQQFVIRHYYGIGVQPSNGAEIANMLNPRVSQSRVSQIHSKALAALAPLLAHAVVSANGARTSG